MLTYPAIDPVAFQLGPVAVHWYGLMYVVGILGAWALGRYHARRPWSPVQPAQVDDLVFWAAIGVIAGGRIGYLLFYQGGPPWSDPLVLFRVWEGGMSFHGGLLGVTLALWLYARRQRRTLLAIADFVAPLVPIGLAAGRFGNFINGELWGKVTDLPWGMTGTGLGPEPRHPSMLYEMLLEGFVLFALLQWFARRPRPAGATAGLFLAGYGVFRFLVELVRLPDPQLGYLAWGWLTMGQLLSLPMILLGVALLAWSYRPRAGGAPGGAGVRQYVAPRHRS